MIENKEIMVSICCTAYNHEKYISQALESFLNQQATFDYEIIVHDDCSTDHTKEIIEQYQVKNQNRVVALYEEENQYSKGIDIYQTYMAPIIRGKYVALCEGDDFWTDCEKLQKQVRAMEENPDCYMCVHKTCEIYENGKLTGKIFPVNSILGGILKTSAFLTMCKRYNFHTSSYLFTASEWKKYVQNPPLFTQICKVGDEPLMLYFGQLGDVYYIEQMMSAYRRGAKDSWSVKQVQSKSNIAQNHQNIMDTVIEFDEYTRHKYHDICVERISNHLKTVLILNKSAKLIFTSDKIKYYRALPLQKKAMIIFAVFCPTIASDVFLKRIIKFFKIKF